MPEFNETKYVTQETKYNQTFTSYSGCDIVASIKFGENSPPLVLGELQTVSYSIHREVSPIRTIGRINPIGFCLPETAKSLVKDKGYISIKDICVGDLIESYPNKYDTVAMHSYQGIKECQKISLVGGYNLEASSDHPIMTKGGWKKAADLTQEDLVAVSAKDPISKEDFDINDDILKMIGYLIGDGSMHTYMKKNNSIEHRIELSIADSELETIGKETEEILNKFNIPFKDNRTRADKCIKRRISVCIDGYAKTDYRLRQYNELHKTIKMLNLYNTYSHTKFIHNILIDKLSFRQIGLLLNRLFSTDGSWSYREKTIRIRYNTTSSRLAEDVRILLNKLGIQSNLTSVSKEERNKKRHKSLNIEFKNDVHTVEIGSAENLLKFIKHVGIISKEQEFPGIEEYIYNNLYHVSYPINHKEFNNNIREVFKYKYPTKSFKKFARKHNLYNYRLGLSCRKALLAAIDIGNKDFIDIVKNNIYSEVYSEKEFIWKKVKSNESIGKKNVYDISVSETESFVANHIYVHNTAGQRTIAGSLIFTVFDRNIVHEVKELMRRTNYARFLETKRAQKTLSNISLMDEMPPFDIDIIMQNEYGHSSRMIIRGVVIVDEGQVMSIEDILTENTMSYLATDIEVLDLTNQPMSNITTPDASYEDIIDAIIGNGETESSIEKVTIKTLQETESYKHYLGLPVSFRGEVYTLYSSDNDIIVYYNYDGKTYYAKVIGDEIANTPGTLEVNEGTLVGLVNVDVDSKIMRIPLVKIL